MHSAPGLNAARTSSVVRRRRAVGETKGYLDEQPHDKGAPRPRCILRSLPERRRDVTLALLLVGKVVGR